MVDIHLGKLLWVYCPGHAGVKVNDWADRLVGKATLTNGLLLRRSKVVRSLRHYLRAQSKGHHTINCLEERGVERRSARRSSLKGQERAFVNLMNIGTVSRVMLKKHLRDGMEHIWAFPIDTNLNGTELNTTSRWLLPVVSVFLHLAMVLFLGRHELCQWCYPYSLFWSSFRFFIYKVQTWNVAWKVVGTQT